MALTIVCFLMRKGNGAQHMKRSLVARKSFEVPLISEKIIGGHIRIMLKVIVFGQESIYNS